MKFFNKSFTLPSFFNRSTTPDDVETPRRPFATSAGTYVNPDSAMQVSAFYRGVAFISTQIATLPWLVKDSQNNILPNDPIAWLIGMAPNYETNSMFWRLCAIQSGIIYGNHYSEIERAVNGRPMALWQLDTSSVNPVRSLNGKLWYEVIGGNASRKGENVYLDPKDVFVVRNIHTKDGITGQSVVSYGRDTLGISMGADKMANGLFANGAIPSGTLEVPTALSDPAYKRLKESWDGNHSKGKMGGTAILEQGVKYNPISIDPDTLQMLQSREFSVLEVARFLSVPPSKLYDVKANTFNNQENANLDVANDVLKTWAINLQMEANIKLLSNYHGGRKTEMELYEVFRGDMETRSKYFNVLMQCAAITPNQIREKEGMPPYAQGSEYYIANNNFSPVSRMEEIIDANIASKLKNSTDKKSTSSEDDTKDEIKTKDSTDKSNGQQKENEKNAIDAELKKAAIEYLQKKTE